ncbi:MAG: nitrogen fixation protein FixH [Burkholderiaceae bacterium]|nr:FixH family protein [Burkholderiaceae bacterium]MCP5218201.1 nitrogen fixation protein FixH [Burkholderiaceae bacterium]
MQTSQEPVSAPWWKYGHMWLVVSGPAIVVVAGFFTLYLAISRPDPVYTDAQRAVVAQPSTPAAATLTPAMQARNHAATGGVARAPRP